MSTFHNINITLNYFINNLLLTIILKILFILYHYLKKEIVHIFFFLILHLTTILKINYIFIIDINLNFLKIQKCKYTSATTSMCSLVWYKKKQWGKLIFY